MSDKRLRHAYAARAAKLPVSGLPPQLTELLNLTTEFSDFSVAKVMGCERTTLRRIREGRTDPKLSFVIALANALGYELRLEKLDEPR